MPRDVVYLPDLNEIAENFKGTIYKANGIIRSIVTKDIIFKNLTGFGGDLELAEECLKVWKDLGYSGAPSSPASFFREQFNERGIIKASVNNLLRPYLHGGWQENFISGSVLGAVHLYDIVKAYLWASKMGYPSEVFPMCKGDIEERGFHGMGIFKIKQVREDLPTYFRKKYFVCSSEDIKAYDLEGEFIRGYSWKEYDVKPFELIMELADVLPPKAWKGLTQGYWGIWAQTSPINVIYSTGKTRKMNNYFQNLIWAQLTINRVIREVWKKARINALSVFVDSILTREMIKSGESIGEWKYKETFPDGVFIKSAGVWTDINKFSGNLRQWNRHSGY